MATEPRAPDQGPPVNGWIVLDKPVGLSSAQAVARVKKLVRAAKAGHGGTLDPLASGVLPIALGEATKTVSLVMDGDKTYRFRIAWGEDRTTLDAEGEVTATGPVRPDAAAIRAALPRFTGEIEQVPPVYSAIKIGGERAYALARAGQTPEMTPRRVRIESLALLEAAPESAAFEMRCSKGTYVRSLARDLAKALGTLGYVAELRRVKSGPFQEKQAISLASLGESVHSAASFVLPVATALDDIPALAVTEDEARRLSRGQTVPVRRPALAPQPATPDPAQLVRAMAADRLVALVRIVGESVRPVRVLQL